MLSPLVQQAALGQLPEGVQLSDARLSHIGRVATLMAVWAERLALPEAERTRWLAAAWLHDALREHPEEELGFMVPPAFRHFPGPLLHGPAAAHLFRDHLDDSLADAIRYHTVGHACLERVGDALYLADFLEPGRPFEIQWRETLRARMPDELDAVLIEVLEARIRHLLAIRKPIRPETASFWTSRVERR